MFSLTVEGPHIKTVHGDHSSCLCNSHLLCIRFAFIGPRSTSSARRNYAVAQYQEYTLLLHILNNTKYFFFICSCTNRCYCSIWEMYYVKIQFKFMVGLILKVNLHFKTELSLDSAQSSKIANFKRQKSYEIWYSARFPIYMPSSLRSNSEPQLWAWIQASKIQRGLISISIPTSLLLGITKHMFLILKLLTLSLWVWSWYLLVQLKMKYLMTLTGH